MTVFSAFREKVRLARLRRRLPKIISESHPQTQIAMCLSALDTLRAEAEPYSWALLNAVLGAAFVHLRGGEAIKLDRIREYFGNAFTVFTREDFPVE